MNEMSDCLDHLQEILKAFNAENHPYFDVSISVHDCDMAYDEMVLKRYQNFEDAFSKFIYAYYTALKTAFDEA